MALMSEPGKKEKRLILFAQASKQNFNMSSCTYLFPRCVCIQEGGRKEAGIRDITPSNPILQEKFPTSTGVIGLPSA